jgi:D-3-phosphoglycerate dehydrogenase / 2-oxoglutarate reductase
LSDISEKLALKTNKSCAIPSRAKYLVVVTDDRFGDGAALERSILEPAGCEVRVASCKTARDVIEAGRKADGLLVNLSPLNAEAIAGLESCRVISRYGVGLDNVDIVSAAARGIVVCNVPGYCDLEVAEHTLGLILALARRIPERDAAVRAGLWNAVAPGKRVAGTTLGLFGFGGAGKAVARASLGLGFKEILVWSPHISAGRIEAFLDGTPATLGIIVRPASFDEVLAQADWVSVHLPLVPDTRGLFGSRAFACMKEGGHFINTSRGGLVDEAALAKAVKSGHLGGAGLDVYINEPLPAESPLRGLANMVFSDHAAYASVESIKELRRRTAENALNIVSSQ